MKKLLIFDFDGTLFDSVGDVEVCFNKALTIHNFPLLTRQEYIDRLGGNIDQAVSLILNENNTPENIELVKNTYEKLYSESNKENTLPFKDSLDVLKKIQSQNILLAINSNRKTDSIKYFVDKFFSEIDFILIEGHNLEYPSKPYPFGVENIIRKAHVSKDEVLYVGDSKTDIETARNAGIDCILVKWGYGNKSDWQNDYILDAIDDINSIFDYI